MDEQQATFKVTDRRLFNADGSPRELIPDEKTESDATPKEASVTEVGAATASAAAPAEVATTSEIITEASTDEVAAVDEEDYTEADIPDAHDPTSFVNFAMSIASNAASALGMMEHPVTHKREVDLELGKHWIDVLGMLQKKTSGNLSPPEAQIIESWLADLRMQFVSLSSSAAKPPAFTGRDIIGGK